MAAKRLGLAAEGADAARRAARLARRRADAVHALDDVAVQVGMRAAPGIHDREANAVPSDTVRVEHLGIQAIYAPGVPHFTGGASR